MKKRLTIALGTGVGTAIYQILQYDVAEVDWARAAFVAAFTLLILFLIPTRWIEIARKD